MEVFWRKGYTETSYDELVEVTGVSRYGLYTAFGDKHALFLAALDHYQDTAMTVLLYELERPDASLPEIKQMFARLLETYQTPDKAGLGCLMCNTAFELAQQDPQIATKVEAQLTRYRRVFLHALENARRKGELAEEAEPEVLADYLTGVVQAGAALDRMRAEVCMIEHYFREALRVL